MEAAKGMTHQQAFYLLKHFTEIDQKTMRDFIDKGYSEIQVNEQLQLVGSKFLHSFCLQPFALEKFINQTKPIQQIQQSNGRMALVYEFTEPVGTEQIISRTTIDQKDIFQFDRNGVAVDAVRLERLPLTKNLVVVRSDDGAWITAFPGNYAPAFPSSWMNANELDLATTFWKNHVFVTL